MDQRTIDESVWRTSYRACVGSVQGNQFEHKLQLY